MLWTSHFKAHVSSRSQGEVAHARLAKVSYAVRGAYSFTRTHVAEQKNLRDKTTPCGVHVALWE